MVSFLIPYGTGEGQTEKVATHIGDAIAKRGHDVTAVDVNEMAPDVVVDDFEAVLVGASVHAGNHQTAVANFVRTNQDGLAVKPTAFFQVSLSSASEDGRAQAAEYVEKFVEDTGWHPDRIGLFGGALRYSKYGFLKRLFMKQIAKRTMSDLPDADTAGDVEFTDWHEVEAFAADVASFVEGRLGQTPPSKEGNGST
ncbi:flavodoxin [Halovivax ruber XH-70]|uniref:Flavodoxin n=1 Tax=Halovivax ruber (strain DSM 18193 / JCM 13892 / XH-70) TaxID=797302 RepID=L0IBT0_HALRX|nr:flavodoxin domain-containing protein [Halovivax ruber]AGB17025.1 flavodoxin [Halovivax ruber XH-70]